MFWVTTSDADSSLVTGQQYGYAFDMIGNRISKTFNDQTESYTANLLNQYSSRTLPGFIWDLGSANSNATVTVNNLATTRKGMYFAGTVPVNNNASAIYTQLLTVGVLKNAGTNSLNIVAVSTGKVFVAQSPEPFSYDLDGNLTADGRWSYTWDAENRLISMVTQASLPASVPRVKLLFAYDYQNRRVSKVVSNYTGGVWVATSNLKFVYDGWNLLAELNQTNAVLRSYAWGLDLSGSQQGAGGIGGLLWTCQTGSSTNFVAYDGNGNVTSLLNTENSQLNTSYEYGPFGELIRATGTSAGSNPFRFSTHYLDQETGLLYAKNRYYNANTGRWLSRDPIGERGGENLYACVWNDLLNEVDPQGLSSFFRNGDATWNIYVDKCEIVIAYGHGGTTPHKFIFGKSGCSAGGFVGCHNAYTNRNIPQANMVPGAPDDEGETNFKINWSEVNDMMTSAQQKAKTFRCCKTVKITVFYVPSDSTLINFIDWMFAHCNWKDILEKTVPGGADQ